MLSKLTYISDVKIVLIGSGRERTMASRNAGSNVPAKERVGLYLTFTEMYCSGFERILAAN